MLVSNFIQNSELYNTFAAMGILCTEDKRIRETREEVGKTTVETVRLTYGDIDRIGYYYPHFMLKRQDKGKLEIWIGDEFINPAEVTWIENEYHLFGILPRDYDIETTVVTIIHNENVFKRYSNIMDESGEYTHIEKVDLRLFPFKAMDNPNMCAYYIADGKICIPEIHKMDEVHWEFHCVYQKSIDLVFCTNLVGIFNAAPGIGLYVDSLYSERCYHHIVVDNDPSYPINTMFYPCILVDKECVVRVYNDHCDYIPHPEISRLMCYPEFMMIDDPYRSQNAYLQGLTPVDTKILGSDDEGTILEKFKDIAPYCYRMWEKFPFFCNEQNDVLMCDNTAFGHPTFIQAFINLKDGTKKEAIISKVPFESYRDILFYDGEIYSDYEVRNLKMLVDNSVIENDDFGVPTYVIPMRDGETYFIDKFTVLKFNTAEDTIIENIGDYIDVEHVVQLHTKLNRFYRNMLVLRGSVLDFDDDTAVRVGTVEPTEKDQNLWFELLVNVIPEKFETNPIGAIRAFGLDPETIPESIRKGTYSLGLKPDGGPAEYTELMMTYFNLSKAHKDYLVMQVGEGIPDPRIKISTEINNGPLMENPELNLVAINNPDLTEREGIEQYEVGKGDPPMDDKHHPGEIYVSVDRAEGDEFDDLLDGIGTTKDTFALKDISYMDSNTGNVITGEEIAGFTTEQKKSIILRYITEGTDEDKSAVKILWERYLNTMEEDTLNVAVYKVLLIDHIYSSMIDSSPNYDPELVAKRHEYIMSEERPENANIGQYWINLPADAPALAVQEAKQQNLKFIMSMREPDVDEVGMLWVDIPAVTLQDYVGDIICGPIMENGYNLPDGFLYDLEYGDRQGAITFDYGAHSTAEDSLELFKAVPDQSLHKVHYGDFFEDEPEDGDIWYEFLEEYDNRVCYSDTESMILTVNERLLMVQFDHDNITAFMFDDILMNFRGKLGIRYLSIVADLVNSGVIELSDLNIFYKRLLTGKDRFDPALKRLYTGRSHVISTAKIDTTDYSIGYSTNIGRFHIDYESEDVTNRERESAWRMVIDYRRRDIAFIGDRMLLFVNGKYIPRCSYKEIAAGKIQLLDFKEVISCVDILYSKKDTYISRAKKIAIQYWNAEDTSVSIQRPERDYDKIEPVHIQEYTHRGFYDVLLNEYILNGRLLRELNYLEEHKGEAGWFVRDLIRKFHAISDHDVVGMKDEDSRIIIPAFGDDPAYTIKE